MISLRQLELELELEAPAATPRRAPPPRSELCSVCRRRAPPAGATLCDRCFKKDLQEWRARGQGEHAARVERLRRIGILEPQIARVRGFERRGYQHRPSSAKLEAELRKLRKAEREHERELDRRWVK